MMPGVPKEVAAAVQEMVSEVAAKAVAEEKNISVRKSSSSASGYVGVLKPPGGRFYVVSVGTFDSAYEAAVAYGMHADEVGKPSASIVKGDECKGIGGKGGEVAYDAGRSEGGGGGSTGDGIGGCGKGGGGGGEYQ